MRNLAIILIFLFYSIKVYSQNYNYKPQAWKLMSYNGSVGLNGQYNQSFSGIDFNTSNYNLGGSVFLSTQSYVWHPNFLTLIVSGGYSPQKGELISSQIPDYFSNLSSFQYNINANFFKTLNYQIFAYALHDELKGEDRFFDRDKTTNKWGAKFILNSAYNINAKIEHQNNKELNNLYNTTILWNKTELQTNIQKTFFKKDQNDLSINIQNNVSEQTNLYKNSSDMASLFFRNSIYLDKKETIPLNTSLNYSQTKATNFNFRNIGFNQIIKIPLVKKLLFTSNFGNMSSKRANIITKDTKFNSALSYALYSSLNTSLSYQYGTTKRSKNFSIENNTISAGITYNKKIPILKGNIRLEYNYTVQNFSNAIQNNILNIYNETKLMEDGIIVLLDNPNIIPETIEVRDVTGTIVYQENVDYILIAFDQFIQIQRLIGGEISNNTVVYIDYDVLQNSSFEYTSEEGGFKMNIDCFNRFLTLSYNNSYTTFTLDEGVIPNFGLDKARNIAYGANFKYKIYNAGITYQNNNSKFFPTKLLTYNLAVSGKLNRKINFNLNAIGTNYLMYFVEGRTHKTILISSDFMYNLNYKTKLNFNLSFSNQKGDIQNFNLISGRSELTTRFSQLELSLGLNYYYRSIPDQDFSSQYMGTFLRLKRNF